MRQTSIVAAIGALSLGLSGARAYDAPPAPPVAPDATPADAPAQDPAPVSVFFGPGVTIGAKDSVIVEGEVLNRIPQAQSAPVSVPALARESEPATRDADEAPTSVSEETPE